MEDDPHHLHSRGFPINSSYILFSGINHYFCRQRRRDDNLLHQNFKKMRRTNRQKFEYFTFSFFTEIQLICSHCILAVKDLFEPFLNCNYCLFFLHLITLITLL